VNGVSTWSYDCPLTTSTAKHQRPETDASTPRMDGIEVGSAYSMQQHWSSRMTGLVRSQSDDWLV
jgi:hypothetical protein